jgi:hypothetical protein
VAYSGRASNKYEALKSWPSTAKQKWVWGKNGDEQPMARGGMWSGVEGVAKLGVQNRVHLS